MVTLGPVQVIFKYLKYNDLKLSVDSNHKTEHNVGAALFSLVGVWGGLRTVTLSCVCFAFL